MAAMLALVVQSFCIAVCSGLREEAEQTVIAVGNGSHSVALPAANDRLDEATLQRLETLNREAAETMEIKTQCWQTMREAGVTEEQKQRMIDETRTEVHSEEFRNILLNYITKSHIEKGDHGLQAFEPESDAVAAFEEASTDVTDERASTTQSEISRTAIFVLGASSSGKTTVTASAVAKDNALAQFPMMTIDGADWRDKSEVWARYAKEGFKDSNGRKCHYKDYYEEVFQKLRTDMDDWTMNMVSTYKPKTVVVPDTAVPCIFPRIWNTCKINFKIEKMEKLGYKPMFFVILADKAGVQEKGIARQDIEGKAYSPKTFELAYKSAQNLMSDYPDATWKFFYNSFDGPAVELSKTDYESRTRAILADASWLGVLFNR